MILQPADRLGEDQPLLGHVARQERVERLEGVAERLVEPQGGLRAEAAHHRRTRQCHRFEDVQLRDERLVSCQSSLLDHYEISPAPRLTTAFEG